MTPPYDPKLARRALNTLMEQGGLATMKDLQDRLGGPVRPGGPHKPLSRQRVEELVAMEGFPERAYPSPDNDRRGVAQLWVWAEVDAWVRAYRERPGKPGPPPRAGR